VPPELETRLFDRFARGTDAPGSGLGLAIARAYARAHGGDIVYDPLERGARFELILPQA
jgi:signal transduction histidine kinase